MALAGTGGRHPEEWWAQFLVLSERFDAAYAVEELGDLIAPQITNTLLRREVETATATVTRHLSRPSNPDLVEYAEAAVARLTATLDRIIERSMGTTSTAEAEAMCTALKGHYAAAAAEVEPVVGTMPLLRLFVTALRLSQFDIKLTTKLLDAGQSPAAAVHSGALVGKYRWWPGWLLRIITDHALAGTLEDDLVAALDNCAYASLSPLQAHLARKLLSADPQLLVEAAHRLEGMGESAAADRLRQGDLNAVALAARLMSV